MTSERNTILKFLDYRQMFSETEGSLLLALIFYKEGADEALLTDQKKVQCY